MTMNFTMRVHSGPPAALSDPGVVYAPSVDKVYVIGPYDNHYAVDFAGLDWSADLGAMSTGGESFSSTAYVFFRSAAHQGNTYGALYIVNPQANVDDDQILIGTIDTADGLTLTWSSYSSGGFGYTSGSSDGYVYTESLDKLWCFTAGSAHITTWDIAGDVWSVENTAYAGLTAFAPRVAFDGNDTLYMLAGYGVNPHAFWRYTISSGSWTQLSVTGISGLAQETRHVFFVDDHVCALFTTNSAQVEAKGIMSYDTTSGGPWTYEALGIGLETPYAPYGYPCIIEIDDAYDVIVQRKSTTSLLWLVNPKHKKSISGVCASNDKIDASAIFLSGHGGQRFGVLKAKTQAEWSAVLRGTTSLNAGGILAGVARGRTARTAVLACGSEYYGTRSAVLAGNHDIEAAAVLVGKADVSRGGVLRTSPAIFTQWALDSSLLDIVQIEPWEFDGTQPMFFNQLKVKYNMRSDGEFANSILLKSVFSQSYYGQVVELEMEFPLIMDQVAAIGIGKQYLLQHHIVPLILTVKYLGDTIGMETMDHVEFSHPTFGISESGAFPLITARIREIQNEEFYARNSHMILLTQDYVYIPPAIETALVSDTGLVVGTNSSRASGLRTFTLLENSEGSPPVVGAEVTIVQTGQTGVTDKFGNVSFVLAPGTYLVRVRSAGHYERVFTEIVT